MGAVGVRHDVLQERRERLVTETCGHQPKVQRKHIGGLRAQVIAAMSVCFLIERFVVRHLVRGEAR